MTSMTKWCMTLASGLMMAATTLAAGNPWDLKTPFKEAELVYKVSGTMTGEKQVYLKDYGRTSASYSDTKMSIFGMEQAQKEIVITTPDWVYTFDMVEKQGSKQGNPQKYLIAEYNKLSSADKKLVAQRAEERGISMIAGLNGSIEKNAKKIQGYQCDKVSAMGSTVYTIAGTQLALRTEASIMGVKIKEKIYELKKGRVDSDKFKLPEGITPVYNASADQMMKDHAKSVIADLLSDEAAPSNHSARKAAIEEDNNESDDPAAQMQKMFQMFGN